MQPQVAYNIPQTDVSGKISAHLPEKKRLESSSPGSKKRIGEFCGRRSRYTAAQSPCGRTGAAQGCPPRSKGVHLHGSVADAGHKRPADSPALQFRPDRYAADLISRHIRISGDAAIPFADLARICRARSMQALCVGRRFRNGIRKAARGCAHPVKRAGMEIMRRVVVRIPMGPDEQYRLRKRRARIVHGRQTVPSDVSHARGKRPCSGARMAICDQNLLCPCLHKLFFCAGHGQRADFPAALGRIYTCADALRPGSGRARPASSPARRTENSRPSSQAADFFRRFVGRQLCTEYLPQFFRFVGCQAPRMCPLCRPPRLSVS